MLFRSPRSSSPPPPPAGSSSSATPPGQTSAERPSAERPSAARPLPLYTRHGPGLKKDWSLTPSRPVVIMGDSNLHRLPPVLLDRVQVDCYPGARFTHAVDILNSVATPNLLVTQVILSFGLNNRTSPSAYAFPQADVMIRRARAVFPRASIAVPLINVDPVLPAVQVNNIARLNAFLASHTTVVPLLPAALFRTQVDNIHWTAATARAMLAHWTPYLG